jgi:hypothetical protein
MVGDGTGRRICGVETFKDPVSDVQDAFRGRSREVTGIRPASYVRDRVRQ